MENVFKELSSLTHEELVEHVSDSIDKYDSTMEPYERIIDNAIEDELFYVVRVKKLDSLKSNLLKKLSYRTLIHFLACALVYGGINIFRPYPLDSMICIYIGQLIAFYSMDIFKLLEECDYKNRKQIRIEKEQAHIRTEQTKEIYISKQEEEIKSLYKLRDFLLEVRYELNFLNTENEEELETLTSEIEQKILDAKTRKLELSDPRLLMQH